MNRNLLNISIWHNSWWGILNDVTLKSFVWKGTKKGKEREGSASSYKISEGYVFS